MNAGKVLALCIAVLAGGYGLSRLVIKDKGGGATASTKSAPAQKDFGPQGASLLVAF